MNQVVLTSHKHPLPWFPKFSRWVPRLYVAFINPAGVTVYSTTTS